MGLFEKRIGVVFLKESSEAEDFIEKMQQLLEKSPDALKAEIEKQVRIARYGLQGEQNIAFELKNSGMDMYVLHDIYLEIDGLSAQIDYLVVTRKNIYVIECKNLIGNIEIDNMGNFIRTYEISGRKIREGIYSPITQNQRHLQVIKQVRLKNKNNFLQKMIFEKNFENNYKSLIVLANSRTCLKAQYAKKEVKQRVIRLDQMVARIKEMDAASKEGAMSNTAMEELARFYLNESRQNKSDYAKKYEELLKEFENNKPDIQEERHLEEENPRNVQSISEVQENIALKLKKFRLEMSREEGIKPYYIFTDTQMNDLIERKPKTKEELLTVAGFGEKKVEKYGKSILNILNEF